MNRHFAALAIGATLSLTAIPTSAVAQASNYSQQSAATMVVTDAYFDAYIALDWDRLEPLLADNATVHDPTAEHLFKTQRKDGKPEVMKGFRQGYAGVTKMVFHKSRAFHSGNFAVYEGDLEWGVKFPAGRVVETRTPFVVILRAQNGKIVEHRDYVDYAPFLKDELASRPTEKAQ